jgi:hypothetical protein
MLLDMKLRNILVKAATKLGVELNVLLNWAKKLNEQDPIESGLIKNLLDGRIDIVDFKEGEPRFRLNKKGHAAVDRLIRENPAARELIETLEKNRGH